VVENEYVRAVNPEGNVKAQQIMASVFTQVDVKWRGFPILPRSGLVLQKKYEVYDARLKYKDELREIEKVEFHEPPGCLCGEVLRGLLSSHDCPLFGRGCTPDSPIGPCMVSVEGSCRIEYQYRKR